MFLLPLIYIVRLEIFMFEINLKRDPLSASGVCVTQIQLRILPFHPSWLIPVDPRVSGPMFLIPRLCLVEAPPPSQA